MQNSPSSDALLGKPRKLDLWEVATGTFVLTVSFAGSHLGETIRDYASDYVAMTIISELSMIWAGIGASFTSGPANMLRRIGGITFAIGVYLLCVIAVWSDFYIIPQALWILIGRFRPRDGASWFGEDNLRRFLFTAVAGWIAVFAQILFLVLVTIVLAVVFDISKDYGGIRGAPHWAQVLIWGAFYFELAVLLPKVEEYAKRDGRKI